MKYRALYFGFPSMMDVIARTNLPGKMFGSGVTYSRTITLNVSLLVIALISFLFASSASLDKARTSSVLTISVGKKLSLCQET